jgi:hypothetical protein
MSFVRLRLKRFARYAPRIEGLIGIQGLIVCADRVKLPAPYQQIQLTRSDLAAAVLPRQVSV